MTPRCLYALVCSMIAPSITALAGPPVAPQKPYEIKQNGTVRSDPYFWLREKTEPAVIAYLQAENDFTKQSMLPTKALQDQLYHEMRGRIQEADSSVPYRVGQYSYYSRTESGKQYQVFCRKKQTLDAPEEVLLDQNSLAAGKKYFRLGILSVSPDHRLLAYSVDFDGSETYTIHIKDLQTGADMADTIENSYYSFAWANDSRTFFYDQLDAAKRPFRACRHQLGADARQDAVVYEEPDERFELTISKTRSRAFIMLEVESKLSSEVRVISADHPDQSPKLIRPRETDLLYSVEHQGDRFFFVTNEHAKNFKLASAPVENPGKEQWEDFFPYDPNIKIENLDAFQNYLVLLERHQGLSTLRVYDARSRAERFVDFPEPTYDLGLGENEEYAADTVRLSYSSLITPASVIDYHLDTSTREVKKVAPVLGGYDSRQYVEERIFATADDGVKIPISLFYQKDLKKNGQAPIFLVGYGAYGISEDANFNATRLSLVDRGFVFAIAHVRGGGELGRTWYEDGKLLKKKNTFTDFIRCAEHLKQNHYGDKLAIWGGSAGGLLIGAVTNLRPDLFTAVVAAVPFVDVLNTMSDPSLPLTVTEFEEWGNPQDPKYFDYIKSYSPYDNVGEKIYPNIFVIAGLNDPRVSYWEPAKWVAKMRSQRLAGKSGELLLYTNMGAGHGGNSGRFDRLDEIAQQYAFILKNLGITATSRL